MVTSSSSPPAPSECLLGGDNKPKQILTRLIGKAAWRNVLESLTSNPEQAKEPIHTSWSSSIVYPLHQAVSRSSTKPIPPSVLKTLINCNPQALDYYVFLGACENKQSYHDNIDIIEILFAEASMETLLAVQTHANDLSLAALGNDNAEIVGMFCTKYPHLLKSDILYQACKNGMPNSTEAILLSAQKHKASIAECLLMGTSTTSFSRPNGDNGSRSSSQETKKESPLEVANRLFDMKNPKRLSTLTICVQYASASRAETGSSPDTTARRNAYYPLPIAAIGWVSPQTCTDIITEHISQAVGISGFVERCALEKAMYMVYEKPDFDEIPQIFQNHDLIQACWNKCPREVHKILSKEDKATKKTRVISRKHDGENAFDLAIELYQENDEESCEVFSACIKYINAIQMNLTGGVVGGVGGEEGESPYEYPTAVAAVGYVTKDILHSVFRKFKHEIRTKMNGKLAIKKLLYLGLGGGEYCNYANRLEKKCMYPTMLERKTAKTSKQTRKRSNMETIFEG